MTIEDPRTRNPFDREALARRALELHGMKYNCAQAVACTLAPLIGADEELCFRAAEGLGGGMGGLTETCGAVSGAAMAIGLANSNGQDDRTSKQATNHSTRSRTMHAVRVVRRNGALGERAIRYHGGDRDETHAERRRSTCPPSLPTSS